MKRKLLILLAFILPVISNQLLAQRMQRVLINKNVPSAPTNIPPYQNPNTPASCTLDTILLTSQADIDNFAINYPTCSNPIFIY
jgi:hypothetical protein